MTDVNQNTNPGQQVGATEQPPTENNQSNQANGQQPSLDLGAITKAIESATAKKEAAILKDYFSKQGLDEEGIKQAVSEYKAKKASENPDPIALTSELEEVRKELASQRLESKATLIALKLGVGLEQAPYLLKMADLGKLADPTDESITTEINKVIEAVPGLKKDVDQGSGFQKVGADSNARSAQTDQDALKKAFGIKN